MRIFGARLTFFERLFSPVLNAVNGLATHGLVRPSQLQILFVTPDLESAMDHIEYTISKGKLHGK
jgi:hypothetical protein